MVALVVPGAGLFTVKGSILGQPWANVWGLDFGGPIVVDQALTDLISTCFETFYASWQGTWITGWTADEAVLADLQTATAPSWDANWSPFGGMNTSDALPSNAAIAVTHRTGKRGRSYRGRTYLCGWGEGSLDALGQLPTSDATGLLTTLAALRSDLAAVIGGGIQLGVVSRKLLEVNPITSHVVNLQYDHQDRRKRS